MRNHDLQCNLSKGCLSLQLLGFKGASRPSFFSTFIREHLLFVQYKKKVLGFHNKFRAFSKFYKIKKL